jgi:hypothetical protein
MGACYAAIVVLVVVSSTACLGKAAKSLLLPADLPDGWGGNTSAPPGGVLGGCSGWLFGFSGLDGLGSETHSFAALVEGGNGEQLRLAILWAKTVAVAKKFRFLV